MSKDLPDRMRETLPSFAELLDVRIGPWHPTVTLDGSGQLVIAEDLKANYALPQPSDPDYRANLDVDTWLDYVRENAGLLWADVERLRSRNGCADCNDERDRARRAAESAENALRFKETVLSTLKAGIAADRRETAQLRADLSAAEGINAALMGTVDDRDETIRRLCAKIDEGDEARLTPGDLITRGVDVSAWEGNTVKLTFADGEGTLTVTYEPHRIVPRRMST